MLFRILAGESSAVGGAAFPGDDHQGETSQKKWKDTSKVNSALLRANYTVSSYYAAHYIKFEVTVF